MPIADSSVCSSEVNPNSSAAPIAPRGLHRPKITAASAMNPRPDVMPVGLLTKAPDDPIVRYAPASPATIPPSTTFQ